MLEILGHRSTDFYDIVESSSLMNVEIRFFIDVDRYVIILQRHFFAAVDIMLTIILSLSFCYIFSTGTITISMSPSQNDLNNKIILLPST